MNRTIRTLVVLTLLAVAVPGAADATVVRVGGLNAALGSTISIRGSATAYDPVNHVYLVVSENQLTVRGRFVNAGGVPVGSPFVIASSPNGAHYPRLAFSPDADGGAGGFLVTWHADPDPGGPLLVTVRARMVSFAKSGPFGAETVLATEGSWWEFGTAIAYATGAKEFLIVFARAPSRYGIRGLRVDNNAAPRGSVFTISMNLQTEQYPSIAYNPVTDQFFVVYSGYDPAARIGFVDSRLIQAGTNQMLGAGPVRLTSNLGTWITDVTYNPRTNQFFVAWFSIAPSKQTLGRLVAADGSLAGNVIALSARWAGTNGLSLSYNTRSNTMFMVSNDVVSQQTGGVELDGSGNPFDNGLLVTTSAQQTQFARLAPSSDDPNWLVSITNLYTTTITQLIGGTADPTAGPIPGPGSPTPSTPRPNPKMNADLPANGSSVASSGFVVAGWALDQGAPSGTGVDDVDVWAYPVGGAAPQFVGTATYGVARGDLAAIFGQQFLNCGYTLVGSLPPGRYDLAVFAHSTVTGTFNNVQLVRVTVQAAASNPKMWIDLPSQNQTTSQSITVAGWALDLGASSGTGVDTIHVWAYPLSGASPVLVGVAQYGTQRPDVASYAGASRFGASGFLLQAAIPAGDYNLVAFAHSTVTNSFNNVSVVRIKVR